MKAIIIDAYGKGKVKDLKGKLLDALYAELKCDLIQIVHPRRLESPYVMIVDEEFLLKNTGFELNEFGSYLYGTDVHLHPILGTIALMKEQGEDIVGLDDDDVQYLTDFIESVSSIKIKNGGEDYA